MFSIPALVPTVNNTSPWTREAGFAAHLVKPLDLDRLNDAIAAMAE